MGIDPIFLKAGAVALVPLAVASLWTAFKLWRADGGAFIQAKSAYPHIADIMFGRVRQAPENRADAPMNDGVVMKKEKGKTVWYLNRRLSDEQYDRMTR